MKYYPAFLNLQGKKAVVVGGGRIAERKVLVLLKAGAHVVVISPELSARLSREKAKKSIVHRARSYRRGDLEGSFLVIAATDSLSVNSRVAADAPLLVNVVDVPAECTFIAPSIVRRGHLTIAISTGGASPALSRTIRKELEKIYGPEIGDYLKFVSAVRKKAMAGISGRKKRERFLKGLASEKMLHDLRTKGLQAVRKIIERQFAGLFSGSC